MPTTYRATFQASDGVVVRRCSICREEKPETVEYFARSKAETHRGRFFQTRCKKCDSARLRSLKRITIDGVVHRKCEVCLSTLPLIAEHFASSPNGHGLNRRCRGCNDKAREVICERCNEKTYRHGIRKKYCAACQVKVQSDQQKAKYATAEQKKQIRDRRAASTHGISLEYLAAIEQYHAGRCGICNNTSTRTLALDHCHKTGAVRGFLCTACNVRLGVHESDWGEMADRYLNDFESRRAEWMAISSRTIKGGR